MHPHSHMVAYSFDLPKHTICKMLQCAALAEVHGHGRGSAQEQCPQLWQRRVKLTSSRAQAWSALRAPPGLEIPGVSTSGSRWPWATKGVKQVFTLRYWCATGVTLACSQPGTVADRLQRL